MVLLERHLALEACLEQLARALTHLRALEGSGADWPPPARRTRRIAVARGHAQALLRDDGGHAPLGGADVDDGQAGAYDAVQLRWPLHPAEPGGERDQRRVGGGEADR